MHLVANLWGTDGLIVLAVVALLFGGSQLPKLARSLGSASHEFRKGVEEGGSEAAERAAGAAERAAGAAERAADAAEKQKESPGS